MVNNHSLEQVDFSVYCLFLFRNSSGELWSKHRKILTPAFHFKNLEQFSDTFQHFGKILIQSLKKVGGVDVDICNFIKLYEIDVICGEIENEIDFSYSCKSVFPSGCVFAST